MSWSPAPNGALPFLPMATPPEPGAVSATVVEALPFARWSLHTDQGVVLAASLDPHRADLGMDIAPGMRVWVRPSPHDPTRGTVLSRAT